MKNNGAIANSTWLTFTALIDFLQKEWGSHVSKTKARTFSGCLWYISCEVFCYLLVKSLK